MAGATASPPARRTFSIHSALSLALDTVSATTSAFHPLRTFAACANDPVMMREPDDDKRSEWRSSRERAETLVDDLHLLLMDLCAHWGFCAALADDIVEACPVLTADGFATALLAAEGWPNPELETEWRPRFARLFNSRYGVCVTQADFERRGCL